MLSLMRAWLWMVCMACLSLASSAAVIDAFTSGFQAVSWPPAQGREVLDVTAIDDSLFDSRFLRFRSGGSQSLTVTTETQELNYSLGLDGGGYFQFGYRSTTPVSLLGDGASVLRFSFASANAGPMFPAQLVIQTSAGLARYSWGVTTLVDAFASHDGAFSIDVPLAEIKGGDLTRVTELTFDAYRISPAASFRLTRIETVPEPASWSLIALATAAACLVRLRKLEGP